MVSSALVTCFSAGDFGVLNCYTGSLYISAIDEDALRNGHTVIRRVREVQLLCCITAHIFRAKIYTKYDLDKKNSTSISSLRQQYSLLIGRSAYALGPYNKLTS